MTLEISQYRLWIKNVITEAKAKKNKKTKETRAALKKKYILRKTKWGGKVAMVD